MNKAVKAWVVDTGVKAVKTSAQTLGALLGASAFNVLHNVPWQDNFGIALGAGLLCVLHNVNSFPAGSDVVVTDSVDAPAPDAPVVPAA
jgi:hypothetical protein